VPAAAAAAVVLVGARLAAVTGSGPAGGNVSLLRSGSVMAGWFADELIAIRAEAELVAGEPASALQVLVAADLIGSDADVLRARTPVELGDLGSAAACLRSRPVHQVSTLSQIQIELIEARLTVDGDPRHTRSLLDRALRAAQREVLRVPVGWAKGWLGPVVGADPLLVQRYGSFLASVRMPSGPGGGIGGSRPTPASEVHTTEELAEPLSPRELEVLQRLSAMSTNAEIAAELFLSVNTVKTHLNAVYRKLEVNRRSSAVRRGRVLGLC
jgi:LuxR family maltose regulon positive regulatory protein